MPTAEIQILAEQSLMIALASAELPSRHRVQFGCRRGVCGKCAVKIKDNADILLSKSQSDTENTTLTVLGKNHPDTRLACQCYAKKTGTITFNRDR